MFAVLNIHKPLGITSHDVVSRLRKIYNLRKIGHLGTLDPLADGVLPVCLGKATRLIEYFPSDKRYTAEITLGVTTSTLDREGDVLEEKEASHIAQEQIQEVLPNFIGTIEQKVPLHSAVHVKGKKLYEYAQKGIPVNLPTKTVTIYDIQLVSFEQENHPRVTLDVRCASGTYIRALARDLGEALGCGAHLSKLARTEHGRFHLEGAVSLEFLGESSDPDQFLLDPQHYLALPILSLQSQELCQRFAHGMKLPVEETGYTKKLKGNQLCYLTHGQHPVCVAKLVSGKLCPEKVFWESPEALLQS